MLRVKCVSTIDLKARAKKLNEVYDYWKKDKNIQLLTNGNPKYFKSFYETITQKDFDYGSMPSMKQIKKLNVKLKKMSRQVSKTPGKLAEWIYLPENILSKNPITKSYFDGLVMAGNFYRGNLEMLTSDVDGMVRMIRHASRETGIMSMFSMNRTSAQKKIRDMEREYSRRREEDPDNADTYYKDNLEKLDKDNETMVIQSIYELITNPEKIYTDKGIRDAKGKYGTSVVQIASLWTGAGETGQYTLRNGKPAGMRDKLFEVLNDGLKDYISVLESHGNRTGTINETKRKVQNILDQFQQQKNYYPTQILELFPALSKISESIYSSKNSNSLSEALPSINRMLDDIVKGLKLTPNIYLSRGDVKRRSKDVIGVIDKYAKNVIRFNYTARSTRLLTEAMSKLDGLKDTDLEHAANFLARYIQETHSTATGQRYKNSKLSHLAKAITSWQFIQKIGLNPGTVMQNATQSLQNFVYFGGKGWYDSMQYIKSKKINNIVKSEMEKHGVFFVNLEELAETGSMLESSQLIDGKIVTKEPGAMEYMQNALDKIAKTTGKPMQWVENKVNRATTFKIAFAKMYKDLNENDALVRKYIEKASKKDVTARVQNEIVARSSRFAANMVKELHYEYSPFAKPKVVQTSAGSILGQFSTYPINFFEYQRKIVSNAKDSALAGDWNSPEMWRAYRLGMLYLTVEGLLTPLTNAKWSNLISNDTKEKAEQMYSWFTGDAKEREKAFFGKGPILGTLGGPFIGDLIRIGTLTGMVKMTEQNWLTYLAGYQKKAEQTKDEKLKESVSLLNLQLSKFVFSSVPKWRDGTGFLTILNQDYINLYNTPEIGKQRENLLSYPQKYGPKMLKPYFTTRKQRERKLEKMKAYWGRTTTSKQSQNMEEIMKSLALLQGAD